MCTLPRRVVFEGFARNSCSSGMSRSATKFGLGMPQTSAHAQIPGPAHPHWFNLPSPGSHARSECWHLLAMAVPSCLFVPVLCADHGGATPEGGS